MAKKKKKSRLKKILKTLGKVALAGGAAYGASKLFGGKGRGAVSTVGQPFGVSRAAYKPSHLGEGVAGHYKDAIMKGGQGVKHARLDYDTVGIPRHSTQMQWGLKKGGRVTGIAKRGFGRALMKGKK